MRSKRIIALLLTTALSVSSVMNGWTSAAKEISKTEVQLKAETKITADSLIKILQDNLVQNTDISKYGNIHVTESGIADAGTILLAEAQNYRAIKELKDVEVVLADLNGDSTYEMLMSYPAGVRGAIAVFRYDDAKQKAIKVKVFYGVTDYRKSGKKIVISQSQNAYTATYTTYKMTKKGKLKKVISYSMKDNNNKKITYKKNKKKITKKAFNKYYKKYDKLKRINFKSLTKDEISIFNKTGETYISAKQFIHAGYYDSFKEVTVFSDNTSETGLSAQNKYTGFWADFNAVKGGGYSDEGVVKRYVFGPDVAEPKTQKTYQQLDWEKLVYDTFDGGYVNDYISMIPNADDTAREFCMKASEIENLKVETGQAGQNGDSPKYSMAICKFTFGCNDIEVTVFEDGEYAGRVRDLSVYNKGCDIPYAYWTYIYGDQAKQDGQLYDPLISNRIYGGPLDNTVIKGLRKVSVNDKATESSLPKYEVAIAQDVEFNLYSGSGRFYTFDDTGAKQFLEPDGIAEYNEMLNPAGSENNYADAKFDKGLFWEPVSAS